MGGNRKNSKKATTRSNDQEDDEDERGLDAAGGQSSQRPANGGDSQGEGDGDPSDPIIKAMRSLTQGLTSEIRGLKTELKQDLANLKDDLKKEFNAEINKLRAEINQKLTETTADIQAQSTRISAVEQRVAVLEAANTDLRDALLHSLKRQDFLQSQVTDLSGRSRRNNIRIYGISETSTEGTSMPTFIDNFLKTELNLEADVDLCIQRAHRSTIQKPQNNEPPRSIVVNFQHFSMKETILKTAWAKKIKHGDNVVNFSHDLPTEVYKKLKEYKEIKLVLKQNKIAFQTPYPARMRIKWDSGSRDYNTAYEAAEDMKKRGFPVEIPTPRAADTSWEQRLTKSPHWKGSTRGRRSDDRLDRAREKLAQYRRQQVPRDMNDSI